MSASGGRRALTLVLAGVTALVLVLSLPGSLRDDYKRHGLYLLSWAFLADIPKRLAGPGRFRFVLQPLTAIALGVSAGRADRRVGRPPFLRGVLFAAGDRGLLLRSALGDLASLVMMGILLDDVCQRLILGVAHIGAALVVGPVLIAVPYTLARALANRVSAAGGS